MTTTASLTVTAEDLEGLTCQACEGPATHTVDVQTGTGTAVESSQTYYLCQVHTVLVLTETRPATQWDGLGPIVGQLNPNTWSEIA